MWTTDYVDAYQRAIAGRRLLIMLFRPPSDTGTTGGNSDNLPGPADLPVLSETVCVLVPTDMRIPGQPPESTARLLDHRSFRHLQGEPGIAVVDLTSTDSPHFGRVVSAFPGATDRRSILAALQPALTLPPGTISQRSLLMAIRAAEPESPLARQGSLEFLNGLANRNCRYMAHLEQSGLFEAEQRREAVYQQFGDDAVLLEHVFATDSPTTLQSAAAAAAAFWKADGKLTLAEGRQVLGYGLDLFESTGSGRWYATLLIVTTPDQ